jgi:hypothetical protein
VVRSGFVSQRKPTNFPDFDPNVGNIVPATTSAWRWCPHILIEKSLVRPEVPSATTLNCNRKTVTVITDDHHRPRDIASR